MSIIKDFKLRNVGEKTLEALEFLEIKTLEELAKQDATNLHEKLQVIRKKKIDPCMVDLFSAIIHEAKTGEKKDWWEFTPARKARDKKS